MEGDQPWPVYANFHGVPAQKVTANGRLIASVRPTWRRNVLKAVEQMKREHPESKPDILEVCRRAFEMTGALIDKRIVLVRCFAQTPEERIAQKIGAWHG